jgi:hypothetical protein
MMQRSTATLFLLLTIGSTAPALAGERGPVCREPSVVDEITREVRAGNYYGLVDPRFVTEQPTTDPRVVRCQVCVQSAPYNTIRFGDHPIEQCFAHRFEIEIVPRGFVVHEVR